MKKKAKAPKMNETPAYKPSILLEGKEAEPYLKHKVGDSCDLKIKARIAEQRLGVPEYAGMPHKSVRLQIDKVTHESPKPRASKPKPKPKKT